MKWEIKPHGDGCTIQHYDITTHKGASKNMEDGQ